MKLSLHRQPFVDPGFNPPLFDKRCAHQLVIKPPQAKKKAKSKDLLERILEKHAVGGETDRDGKFTSHESAAYPPEFNWFIAQTFGALSRRSPDVQPQPRRDTPHGGAGG